RRQTRATTALLLAILDLLGSFILCHSFTLSFQPASRQPRTSAFSSPADRRLSFHHRLAGIHDVAAIDPDLDPDHAESGICFGESVIHVRAQCVQRQTALQRPFRAGDFGAVQAAADAHFDPLGAEPLRLVNRLAHGAAEGDALLELLRDLLGLELRVQFGLVNLLNADEDFAAGAAADLFFERLNLLPLAPDDDAGARGVDDDLQAVGRAINLDLRDAGAREPRLQLL